ncbi:MAG: SDR family NAD(P)-dependent oxidoreductase [Rubricoccaceae bacterium]
MNPSRSRHVVLVAGASSGIGQAAARVLALRGHTVFGTSRDAARVSVPGVRPLALDVTDAASVEACVAAVDAAAGRLDALVYSAGFYVAGAVEEVPYEQALAQFEAYFFGAHRLTRTVLPGMRARRFGRLVYLSSSAGVTPIPYHALYSASKAALEHYCRGLRYEVEPLGVGVSYLQAGPVRTGAPEAARPPEAPLAAYTPVRERAAARFREAIRGGLAPSAMGRAAARAVEAAAPRPVYRVGVPGRLLPLAEALLPEAVLRAQMRRVFGLRPPAGRGRSRR